VSNLDTWDARYAGPEYWFGTAPAAFLLAQAPRLRPGLKALAIADGEGRNGVWLAEQGLDVSSVDFAPHAIEKARRLAAQRGVKVAAQQADITRWAWPEGVYDVVAAIFIQFADSPEREGILAGIKQALKPGGLLLLHGYRPEQVLYGTGGTPVAARCYSRSFLQMTFAEFAAFEIREHDSVIQEGTGHAGLSALIDLIGVK
jgi:2-polyprenyl-3-methyl-5-hydroxy-6-metoxy-1,4-benzoquinol methylase